MIFTTVTVTVDIFIHQLTATDSHSVNGKHFVAHQPDIQLEQDGIGIPTVGDGQSVQKSEKHTGCAE